MSATPVEENAAANEAAFTWTSEERESFFAAIARHRRAAWRVTLASGVVNALAALVVAALMAPLFYVALALLFDLINIVRPAPSIVALMGHEIGPAFDAPETVSVGRWIYLLLLAAAPGLIWMAFFLLVLRRAIRVSELFGDGDLASRAPDATVLAEQRTANVVGEIAVAANLPAPRVRISDHGGINAAVFGRDEGHATIIVSRGLLHALNREQMQGIAGHLVGSIANGDMKIGVRMAITLGLFGLIARMASVFTEGRAARRLLGRLAMAIVRPTAAGTRGLMEELSDPMAPERNAPEPANAAESGGIDSSTAAASATSPSSQRSSAHQSTSTNDWRTYIWMPLAGPVAMTGFFGAIVNMFLLEPLVSLAWRRRKYMADATAVRLTRQPDALASALEKMSGGAGALFGAWAAHLLVVRARANSGLMGSSVVPPFPSIARRLRALAKMGAQLRQQPQRMPLGLVLILTPLFALVGALACVALYLLVFVSIALSMLFLGLPFGIVHVFLRWIGGE